MAYIQSSIMVLVLMVAVSTTFTSGTTLDEAQSPTTTTHRPTDVQSAHRQAVREDDIRWTEEVEQEEEDDRRWDSPFLKDVLDWAETHAKTNRITKRKLSLGGLRTQVEMAKTALHDGSVTCGQRTLTSCDLRTMSQLTMVEDSPCTLLQEYQMCVARETALCPSGDGALLQASIRHLVVGLQEQGHCAAVNTQPEVASSYRHAAQPCMRKGAWMCVNSFTEDLKMFDVPTCTTVANFRHCLHTRSSSCNHDSANLLIRGSKGLSRLYRRLTHEC